jgi:two-component system CheB/CheR fusion protein
MPTPTVSGRKFPIVGIGASAGGLQALSELFRRTPSTPGMAYVVVMHLSPTHESNACALLQACTAMEVIEVTQPTHVDLNRVYVISPNKQLEMIDGYLSVKDRPAQAGWPIAIDVFFHTLAAAHQSRAIGIVLSGTGTDGVGGLASLKDRGGIVLAQDPADAEFSGMPRAAIESGLVDFVLPVADMPAALEGIRVNAEKIVLPAASDEPLAVASAPLTGDEEILHDILALLRNRTGHDFSRYKRSTVLRRIERRLQVRQKPTLALYRELLQEERNEANELLRDMLIGVTEFFRDREAFEVLEREVVPELFKHAGSGEAVRVWSVGCSTGEETYSLAMLLAEHAAASATTRQFQVFGSDIDERAISSARTGLYGPAAVRNIAPARRAKHFNMEEGKYRIKKAVRDQILFASQNLLRDPPFSKLDLICCRNLLIYLNRDAHAAVLEMFHSVLKPGGFLFLGNAESADALSDCFTPFDKKQRIYRAKAGPRTGRAAIPTTTPAAPAATVSYPERSANDKNSYAAVHQRVLAEHAPPSVLVDQHSDIVHSTQGTAQFLRHVAGKPSRNLVALVEPELQHEVRAALYTAIRTGKSIETRSVRFERGARVHYVSIVVRPFFDAASGEDLALVLFHKTEQTADADAVPEGGAAMPPDTILTGMEGEIQRLREQLQETIEHSETSTEELKAANEELQAINEELRSATEEIETSKEELQSVNEELITVNYELKSKVEETGKVNDDLQNLIASTDLATIFVDRDMRIKRYTPHACDVFNLISSDVGRPLHNITHKLHYPELGRDAATTFETLQPVEREVSSVDGRWFIARLVPYRTGLDQIDGAVLTFIDITSRRLAEERARAGEERMRLVADSTKDYAIITMDIDGLITSFNSGAERIFGYTEEEILGKPDAIIFTPEDRAAGVPDEEKGRAREEGRAEDERWHLRKDGSRFFCSGVMTPLQDGELTGYAKIGRDLTGRKQAELGRAEQLLLEQSLRSQATFDSEQKDEFLAIMAHELKHPLNLIHMHSEVLLRMAPVQAVPQIVKAARTIRASTISQAKIINDLLDLSRVTTGKMTLNRSRVDIAALAALIIEVVGSGPSGPKVIANLPPGNRLILDADEVRLEQVVWNLLSNAVKFTPPEGTVTLSAHAEHGYAILKVADTGAGIRASALQTIFDIFKQERGVRGRGVEGLGIGLALVKQIVELHGGTVTAESPGPGKGATFTVSLPLAGDEQASGEDVLPPPNVFKDVRILLVDDSEDSITVFAMLLEMEGAKVSATQSAREALALLGTQAFDLVLSDISMPEMDGLSFIRALRKRPNCQALPALAITGMGRQKDIDDAIAAGFSGYLAKPLDMNALARQVTRLLDR